MRLISAIAAVSLLASPVFAASAISSATANVILPVTVSNTQGLAFGTLARPAAGSANIALAANGTLTSGGVFSSGPHSQATFTVSGEPNTAVSVVVDPTAVLTGSNPPHDTLNVTLTPDQSGSLVLSPSGSATINVGGSFTLPNTNQTGGYNGNFTVTANYQ